MVDFLFVLFDLFRYLLRFRSYEAKYMYVFAGVDLFAIKFYPDKVVPQKPFLVSEN